MVLARLVNKIGRLVHVVPDSSYAVFEVCAVEVAPPTARLRLGIVHEHTLTGPDLWNEKPTIPAMLEIVLLDPLLEDVVAGFLWSKLRLRRVGTRRGSRGKLILHTRVNNRYDLHTLLAELRRQCLWIRESLLVKSKDAITAHVIDIEVDHIKR